MDYLSKGGMSWVQYLRILLNSKKWNWLKPHPVIWGKLNSTPGTSERQYIQCLWMGKCEHQKEYFIKREPPIHLWKAPWPQSEACSHSKHPSHPTLGSFLSLSFPPGRVKIWQMRVPLTHHSPLSHLVVLSQERPRAQRYIHMGPPPTLEGSWGEKSSNVSTATGTPAAGSLLSLL